MICYLINILVSGKTEADHLENLQKVLKTLQRYGVRAKKSKCSFLQKSVQYLGHRIDVEGIHATDSKIQAIVKAPTPSAYGLGAVISHTMSDGSERPM